MTGSLSLHTINFLKPELSEFYGIDQKIGYQHAQRYIRQLAIHLRSKNEQTESIVCNWQYLHSLDFFSIMLSQHVGNDKNSPLQLLVYPLVQITLGAINLNPTPQYYPLRFYLVGALLKISRSTGFYINLAPVILEPLESEFMKASYKKDKKQQGDEVNFDTTLRVSGVYLSGPSARGYRDQVVRKMVKALARFFDLQSPNPAFQELAMPSVTAIKAWVEKHGSGCGGKARKALNGVVEVLEEHAKWVKERKVPMDVSTENQSGQDINEEERGPLPDWLHKQI
jgi:nucleolar complex protein 2